LATSGHTTVKKVEGFLVASAMGLMFSASSGIVSSIAKTYG